MPWTPHPRFNGTKALSGSGKPGIPIALDLHVLDKADANLDAHDNCSHEAEGNKGKDNDIPCGSRNLHAEDFSVHDLKFRTLGICCARVVDQVMYTFIMSGCI